MVSLSLGSSFPIQFRYWSCADASMLFQNHVSQAKFELCCWQPFRFFIGTPDSINGTPILRAKLPEILEWAESAQCLGQDGVQARRTALQEQRALGEPFREAVMELYRLEDAGLPTTELKLRLRDMVLEQHARVGTAPVPELD